MTVVLACASMSSCSNDGDVTVSDNMSETFKINGVEFTMLPVEGGTFTMGATEQMEDPWDDEFPLHKVTVSSFYIGQTEVTQELWTEIMGEWPFSNEGKDNPAENISWKNCQDFVNKLSELTGRTFRLPTEAEWEFAARGGNLSKGYQYSGSNNVDEVAWYGCVDDYGEVSGVGNSDDITHPVAQKKANELGTYDMSGNVWEWCSDWRDYYTDEDQVDPKGPATAEQHVYRGGCFYYKKRCCRVSHRSGALENDSLVNVGLRLVMVK